MTKSDRRQCYVATRVIDAWVKGKHSLRDSIDDLNGAICFLSDQERELSLFLRRKWAVLQEIQFYTTYRCAAPISLEQRALIESVMNEMKDVLVDRLRRSVTPPESSSSKNRKHDFTTLRFYTPSALPDRIE